MTKTPVVLVGLAIGDVLRVPFLTNTHEIAYFDLPMRTRR